MLNPDRTIENYKSATVKGLDKNSLPYRLYDIAKKFGVWNPKDIDFSKDKEDWKTLTPEEKALIVRVCTLFVVGEESVTYDLVPLVFTMAKEGRTEEEMYLTTFLFEESKHVEFFRAFMEEVIGEELNQYDMGKIPGEGYGNIFYVELPRAMERLLTDSSPTAQVEAACTYNMVVEGILAETGYHAFESALKKRGQMPGLLEGISYTKRDESRHIGYGQYLIQRHIAQDKSMWDVAQKRIEALLPSAIDVVRNVFDGGKAEGVFGLKMEDFINFAMKQFQIRMDNLERALTRSVEEIYNMREEEVGAF